MNVQEKHLVFCGAGLPNVPGRERDLWSPRTTMGKIVERALKPLGYTVDIDLRGFGMANPRLVASGEADLGILGPDGLCWAYEGKFDFANEGPRSNLRIIGSINFPAWLGVAARWETGITDLGQIKERQQPVRIVGGRGPQYEMILAHYGLSRKLIESYGGKFLTTTGHPLTWFITNGDYDLILDAVYAANTPEARHWTEASIRHQLRFLPLPDDLIQHICDEAGGSPGFVPHQLLRGVDGDVPTVARDPHAIYTTEALPEDFAYLLTKTLDQNRHLFREVYLHYSYDPQNVARDVGIPFHPGAERYYREVGYLG